MKLQRGPARGEPKWPSPTDRGHWLEQATSSCTVSRSLGGAPRNRRNRSRRLQLFQLRQHIFPIILVLLRFDRSGEVGIKVQNVVAQLRSCAIELPACQLSQQLGIGVVG